MNHPTKSIPLRGMTIRKLEGTVRMLEARIDEAARELQVARAALAAARDTDAGLPA